MDMILKFFYESLLLKKIIGIAEEIMLFLISLAKAFWLHDGLYFHPGHIHGFQLGSIHRPLMQPQTDHAWST
jgi:hypothetical protein